MSLVGLFAPGLILSAVAEVLSFRARDDAARGRASRLSVLASALVTLLPGIALAFLVLLGRMPSAVLIAAALLIALGVVRAWTGLSQSDAALKVPRRSN